MADDQSLRMHLIRLLEGRGAHADIESVLERMAFEELGRKPPGAPHTLWQVFEHMRIAQWDIVEFSQSAEHLSPEFPLGYWPKSESPENEAAWKERVAWFRKNLETMKRLVSREETNLFETIPHGTGQTILREALLVADHNAYHTGQLVLMLKMLDLW